MKRSRWTRWLPAMVLVLGISATVWYRESMESRAKVGAQVPPFTLQQLDGGPVSLADSRGKVVFLNFWTTWCQACREETPALETFYRRYGDRVAQYGINLREPLDTIRSFNAEYGTTYPVLLDRTGKVAERYRLKAVPESWFIDPQGVARVYHQGALTFEGMVRGYEQAMGASIDPAGAGAVPAGGHLHGLVRSGAVLLAATHAGLHLSDDGGRTWEKGDVTRTVLAWEIAADGALWAATDQGLWRFRVDPGSAGQQGRKLAAEAVKRAPARILVGVAAAGSELNLVAPNGDVYTGRPGALFRLITSDKR